MSTYGPSERKILKERRKEQTKKDNEEIFGDNMDVEDESDSLLMKNFRLVKAQVAREQQQEKEDNISDLEFDGCALQDLLVSKWGQPLDISFRRLPPGQEAVYCTIMPISFGSRKCRH
eukprot:CAMPEP_0194395330 /NCGR_PEP_ID=MMETSP0174-20130528/124362_1 /TAXON_ID=216777 /ORGANISM="Proboscia alata, Strain PI-D3" /LENGTH=117 /DNA_ID=CAMNT_0039191251 /DNA_START=312 /DNA_END=665 /DNA_ORIENTATION=+